MHKLAESLAEYGDPMLRAIAGQWQVEVGDPGDLPARLAAAMLEPERLQAFLASLAADARAALAQVAAAGGTIRGYLLTRVHGEMRRLGPKAIERETPWRNPASATERLWYAGLIFRRYSRLGGYHGEIYYIPNDLLAVLPPQQAPAPSFAVQMVEAPAEVRDEGDNLALDLEALLACLRLDPVAAMPDGGLPPAFLAPFSGRWRGGADPERLAFLQRLAFRSRLIVKRGGLCQVGAQARGWLQAPPYRRQKLLFDTWQGDAHWNELWHIPTLRCEETGWRNDPLAPKAVLLEALRHCPEGWLCLADLVAALKATQPDLARPDGDYDSWYIQDVATGQYLQGFAHWDDVEGALIRHLIGRSLYWLGAVALSVACPEGGMRTAYMTSADVMSSGPGDNLCVTASGRAFLRQTPPPSVARPAPFAVREDLTIIVPRAASAYDRVRVERFARWQGREGDADLYRMEPECIWQALNSGIEAPQIAGFLQRATGQPLPPTALGALHAWSGSYGRVTLRRALLLQTANAETLRLLRSDPELAQRLGATVSERAILVPEEEFPHVLARLKELGWWPRLEGMT